MIANCDWIGSRSRHKTSASIPYTASVLPQIEFRNKPWDGFEAAILQKEVRLKALWSKRLVYQMSTLPQFDDVFRATRRALRTRCIITSIALSRLSRIAA